MCVCVRARACMCVCYDLIFKVRNDKLTLNAIIIPLYKTLRQRQGILEIIKAQLYLHVYPLQAVIELLIFRSSWT